MDFLDPKKKRAHRIRLYIGYGLMAIALGFGTIILVFAAYGYDIDRHTGSVIQNGLVIVDAHPVSATVFLDNIDKGSTDSRLVLPAGKYQVELRRDGYRNWSHVVNVEGSSIEQLIYPFLFPNKLVSKNLQDYSAVPAMASVSPDRHWLVVHVPGSANSFQVVDLNAAKNPTTTISLPTDTFTAAAGAHSYESIEWSTDNTHLLLKHSFSGGAEFVMLDRDNPASSLNINKLFKNTALTTVSMRDKKADQLYFFNATEGSLIHADTKAKVLTPVLNHVFSYKSYQDNTLLYAATPAAGSKEIEVHAWQDGQDYLLRTLPVSDNYLLEMAQFNGHFYIVSGSSADGRAYLYKDPFSSLTKRPSKTPQPFRVLVVPGAQYVSFSAIARFVAIQAGSNFAVYDIETARGFRYDTKLALPASQKASWMDGHRLIVVSEGFVQVFDFDGTNLQKLSATLPAFTPVFDRDYEALFTLPLTANTTDKATLTRTELRILPANQAETN